MKFYNLNDVPIHPNDTVFKVPIWELVVGVAVCIGLLVGILGFWLPGQTVGYYLAAIVGLMGWLMFGGLRAAIKPTNWLLRCNETGLIIKYRSYSNWRMPAEDVQAVAFDYSEIAWIRTAQEKRTVGMGGDAQQTLNFLDLCLANGDASELEKQLQDETSRPCHCWRVLFYPAEVLPGGIIRLKWQNCGGGAYSNASNAVKHLQKYVKVANADSSNLDLTHQKDLPPGAEDAKILKLAKGGDRMAAIKLTREIYGCSLTEAVSFVDNLQK